MFIQSKTGGQMGIFWGQSPTSYDAAVLEAIKAAEAALPGKTLEWFEAAEFRGGFENGKPQFQVAVRIGYA